ncbi:MAG: orotate phosphoribosyltransferase [Gemmatimonadetes bacterium]|nr:orotate phosphoribosyltransferase [Gemmatimonadota bacterium]
MREEALLKAFQETNALRRGHFRLSSGLHSGVYFQSALVLQHPDRAEVLGRALAKALAPARPEAIVGPALGGLIIGWEVARELDVRGLFTERKDGVMELRRGFVLSPGERVAVVEDVVTTGKSTRETMEALRQAGGEVVAVGAIVDRSGGGVDFGVPFHSLLSLPVETWDPEACPECQRGAPLEKPGSRPDVSTRA